MSPRKTPGETAYEEDVRRRPTYHTGERRQPFATLCPAVRDNWERYPTPRNWGAT